MVPQKYEDDIRQMAYRDGAETAQSGGSADDCEWMMGTIFFDDFQDGFRSVAP